MPNTAEELAEWAYNFVSTEADQQLAQTALVDTLAATLAARTHNINRFSSALGTGGRWAAAGHVLDYDDLHLPSTTHISVVCVPAALADNGDERAYLAGAGVMARLGIALGWQHYERGWHATCTTGAPAAAVAAGVAMGLSAVELAHAISLSIPAAGGVQRAFGSDGKSLQVGFAVDAGHRAATLAREGARSDTRALDAWMDLVTEGSAVDVNQPEAVPGGLGIKIYPACYALQRPINAISTLRRDAGISADEIASVVLRTPSATIAPLNQHSPMTGLEAKFSIEYAVATALLDDHQGFSSFEDSAVRREDATRLMEAVTLVEEPGGDWLLAGMLDVELQLKNGQVLRTAQKYPPGSPDRPSSAADLRAKVHDCAPDMVDDILHADWAAARHILHEAF